MTKGKIIALISCGATFIWAGVALAQEEPPLPPLPEQDPVSAEMSRLDQEADGLRQEAREIGGGRTISESTAFVRNKFYENVAAADDLEQIAEQTGHTEDELRAEQRRIEQSGDLGVADFFKNLGKFAGGQARDEGIKRLIEKGVSEAAGKAFGAISGAGTCYDVGKGSYDITRAIKLRILTWQQARSLGNDVASVRRNWFALNAMLIALYGENALQAAKMDRLKEIRTRYDQVQDRIATLRQQQARSLQPATSQANLTRETDSGYDRDLLRLERLKFERRIAGLQGNDREVRRLDREIGPLEQKIERAEAVPNRPSRQRGQGTSDSLSYVQPLDKVSTSILAYHNGIRERYGLPAVEWNPALAAGARQWAQVMAQTGKLQHSPRNSHPANERENIVISRHGANSPMKMLETWGSEEKFVNREKLVGGANFDDVCNGEWTQCGHFIPIVWSRTTDVGCAFAQAAGFDALVCRYTPKSNIPGKPVIDRAYLETIRSCPPKALLSSRTG